MLRNKALIACGLAAILAQWAQAAPLDAAFAQTDEFALRADRDQTDKRKLPFKVKIIGFNDFHGHLQSPGSMGANTNIPPAQRHPVGGADYIAAYVARLKAQNPHNAVVGAGDFIGASPLISALFFDEPAVEALNRIGVDFNAVGNHEFDKGWSELLRLQHGGCKKSRGVQEPNSCQGALTGTPVPFEGAKFKWLSANVISKATGKTLLPPVGIKKFKGVRVAFIGMTLEDTPKIVSPAGVAGLEFRDEADTVNALVPKLRAQGIESIVVLVHQGGTQSTTLADINGCDGNLAGSELAAIVSRLDDAVDLVVSGHTHAAYNCSASTVDAKVVDGAVTTSPRPTGLPNSKGRLIPATSASSYGRVLTDIDLTIDPKTRNVTAVSAANLLVDRTDTEMTNAIVANPRVKNIVTAYNSIVSPIANQIVGSIMAELPPAVDDAGNMPAGELIVDAQLAATAPSEAGGAVVAFINPGGVRNPGFTFTSSPAAEGDGNITYGEAFTTQPFGNTVVTVTLTAQDIKNVLEQQFAGCRGQTQQRILIASAGFKFSWDSSKACDARISNVRLVDSAGAVSEQIVDSSGNVTAPLKTYRVAINAFLASGGDGFTTFALGTNLLGGPQDIDALTAYLARFKRPNLAAYDPTAPALLKPRIVRIQ